MSDAPTPLAQPSPDAALVRLLTSMPQFVERIADARRVLHDFDAMLAALLDGSYVESPLRECLRCGHRWHGKTGIFPPKTCPRCSSSGWNSPPSMPHHRRPGDVSGAANRRRLDGLGHRRQRRRVEPSPLPMPTIRATPPPSDPVPPEELIGTRPPLPPGMRSKSKGDELWERAVDSTVKDLSPLPQPEHEDLGLGDEEETDDASR